jgi:hypothetical protein
MRSSNELKPQEKERIREIVGDDVRSLKLFQHKRSEDEIRGLFTSSPTISTGFAETSRWNAARPSSAPPRHAKAGNV